ncbi:alpha/beta hydrolase [Candidatus Gracilibacteria bacterium]|nr:alpha/beta hydrolase [Candidatus Gracilibacteria bacterium]
MQWQAWEPDILVGFEARTLELAPDYDGPVVATLVRRRFARPSAKAVLYIHGFVDYFYQVNLAEAWLAQGYNFYALDLRKYGRSLRSGQHPNFCSDLAEYDAEITAALALIAGEEGCDWIMVNGHSTGGLIAARYAQYGAARDLVQALFLNSPFLAFNISDRMQPALALIAQIGERDPFRIYPATLTTYGESIHRTYHGEWDFDLRWKPMNGFPTYYGWMRAIHLAQRDLQRGWAIRCPVLVMHAAQSLRSERWNEAFQTHDVVLNVEHIRRFSLMLGGDLTLIAIANALHDLALARSDVRAEVFRRLLAWVRYVEDCRLI